MQSLRTGITLNHTGKSAPGYLLMSPCVHWGAQRLSSGNTLIREGAKGCNFEVTSDSEVVRENKCPLFNEIEQYGKSTGFSVHGTMPIETRSFAEEFRLLNCRLIRSS